jgi:hypothetical protein
MRLSAAKKPTVFRRRSFIFYIDDNGLQDIRGPGRKRCVRLGLRDLSVKLRKTDEERDWTAPAVFTYSVICDKTQPERSLVHGIAQWTGLAVNDIDCSTIPVTLSYVRLRKDIWAELSELATAYLCHLECAPEKPLVFAHSPYQREPLQEDDYSYFNTSQGTLYLGDGEEHAFYLKSNEPAAEISEISVSWLPGDGQADSRPAPGGYISLREDEQKNEYGERLWRLQHTKDHQREEMMMLITRDQY